MGDWKITTQLIIRAESHEEALPLTRLALANLCDADRDIVIGARIYLTDDEIPLSELRAENERLRGVLSEIIEEGYDGQQAVEQARNALGMDTALSGETWNTCPLHGHYVARDPGGELRDCPSCDVVTTTGEEAT